MKSAIQHTALIVIFLFSIGCKKNSDQTNVTNRSEGNLEDISQKNKNEIPKEFQESLNAYLKDGLKLSAMSSNVIINSSLWEQYATTITSFKMSEVGWPDGFCEEAKDSFKSSLETFKLAQTLSNLHVELGKSGKCLAETNREKVSPEYLPVEVLSELKRINPDCTEDYRAWHGDVVEAIDFGKNIGFLLTASSEQFEQGRSSLLANGFGK